MYGLNDEQIRAIQAKSPTMIAASAGAGKTRALVAKVLLLLDTGANPSSICAVTFTNRAANEMKERIRKTHPDIEKIQVSTIHSMCVRIIREYARYTPLRVPFSIYDEDEQISILRTILKARNMDNDPREVLSAISMAKVDLRTDELEDPEVYKQYQEVLKKNNACDFDDLLIYANECLSHQDCQEHYTSLWRHILVDEVQDTSRLQFGIIMKLYDPAKTQNLFMIGDENQSLYSWRGAHPENIQDFIKNHNPTVCHLTYNYRSGTDIIKHANEFLQYGKDMVAKNTITGSVSMTQFLSLDDEADRIAMAIKQMGGYESTAILYRVNSRSVGFERSLTKFQIPYRIVGALPFFRFRVIKDLLAALKASNNPSDIESLSRIINNPKRGFGDTKREKLLLEGLPYAEAISLEMPVIGKFLDLLKSMKGQKPYDALDMYLKGTGYRESCPREEDGSLIDTLLDLSSEFSTVEEMILTSAFLDKDSKTGVSLMSAHASKGLEFDKVFVVGVEAGVWPHAYSLNQAEEERVFYVALTRAKKYLNVSYSKSKSYRGNVIQSMPSDLFKRLYKSIYSKDMTKF